MRAADARNVLIYCTDYTCSRCVKVPDDADRRPDALKKSFTR
ncbi:hypothetical protein [Bradyrhizobium sp. ARR65]|nr:hypothetical protein [Bradyrhizobium sp. ARR65]